MLKFCVTFEVLRSLVDIQNLFNTAVCLTILAACKKLVVKFYFLHALSSSVGHFSAVATFGIDASAQCLRVSLRPRCSQSEKSTYTERKFNDINIFNMQFEKL